jgi:hypothetical protein
MGERCRNALRLNFDRKLKLEVHGTGSRCERSKGTVMKGGTKIVVTVFAVAMLVPSVALATLREVEKGVFVEDFEDGNLGQLAVDEKEKKQQVRVPEALEIVKDGGKAALHLIGRGLHNRVYYQDRKFKDFSLEVRMKKTSGSYAGVVVRDHWRVYLQMRNYLSLNSDLKGFEGELFKSGDTFDGYHALKVVCAGPLLHVYVDSQHMFDYDIGVGEGRVGFYSHGRGQAYYDDLRIDTHVGPVEYLAVEPLPTDNGLVFPPDKDVNLQFKLSNHSGSQQRVSIAASVKTWGGAVVKQEMRRPVSAGAGEGSAAEFHMGRIPAGFYRVDLQASCAAKQFCKVDDLPMAVQELGSGEFTAPVMPVAAYYKYFNKKYPLYQNTYAHAAARSLKDHHFNTVVADPSFNREIVDIFQSYGIATIARSGALVDHPAVIATLLSDEPKPEEIEKLKQDYQRLCERADKPITTCLVGEGMGLGAEGGPLWIWRQLGPELRCFRWYGVKKSFYGLLHDPKYKGWLPLSSVLRIAEASSTTPYWFVAPALGRTDHEAYYHKPTPAETRGMMHLALAYGADGILFWAFQSHRGWPCFVDQQSLEPIDGNYAAAAEVAAQITAHAHLLAALRLGGMDVRCPSPVVDARPLHDSRVADRGRKFVYVVNKDTKNPVSTRLLLWAERWAVTSVRDVYSGRKLHVKRDNEGYLTVSLTLAPGQGQLLATDVADVKEKK